LKFSREYGSFVIVFASISNEDNGAVAGDHNDKDKRGYIKAEFS
jgi:hypothetical protein